MSPSDLSSQITTAGAKLAAYQAKASEAGGLVERLHAFIQDETKDGRDRFVREHYHMPLALKAWERAIALVELALDQLRSLLTEADLQLSS